MLTRRGFFRGAAVLPVAVPASIAAVGGGVAAATEECAHVFQGKVGPGDIEGIRRIDNAHQRGWRLKYKCGWVVTVEEDRKTGEFFVVDGYHRSRTKYRPAQWVRDLISVEENKRRDFVHAHTSGMIA